jgi:hypothetical protein
VLSDAVRRMITRIGHQAERAARKPAYFLDWLDRFPAENERTLLEVFLPVQRAMLAMGLDGSNAGGWLLDKLRSAYLEISGQVTQAGLGVGVAQTTAKLLDTLPAAAASEFLGAER